MIPSVFHYFFYKPRLPGRGGDFFGRITSDALTPNQSPENPRVQVFLCTFVCALRRTDKHTHDSLHDRKSLRAIIQTIDLPALQI
jgi:hypothetical protein